MIPTGRSPILLYVTHPIPGEIWSHQLPSSTLRILRVVPRGNAAHRFVLTRDNAPIVPPFQSLTNALIYVTREWVPLGAIRAFPIARQG